MLTWGILYVIFILGITEVKQSSSFLLPVECVLLLKTTFSLFFWDNCKLKCLFLSPTNSLTSLPPEYGPKTSTVPDSPVLFRPTHWIAHFSFTTNKQFAILNVSGFLFFYTVLSRCDVHPSVWNTNKLVAKQYCACILCTMSIVCNAILMLHWWAYILLPLTKVFTEVFSFFSSFYRRGLINYNWLGWEMHRCLPESRT